MSLRDGKYTGTDACSHLASARQDHSRLSVVGYIMISSTVCIDDNT